MKADLGGEDSRWLTVEDAFTAGLTNTYETLFTTGNGYLGTRGSLEEGHEGVLPGTFLRCLRLPRIRGYQPGQGTRLADSGGGGRRRQAGRNVGLSGPPPDDPQLNWHKWARSRHLDEVAREHLPDGLYLETRTIDTGITIGYAALTKVSPAAESSVEQRYKYTEQVAHARYFGLATLPVAHDGNDMPMYPPGYHHYNLAGINLVKQADVVMLSYVLPDEFSETSSAPTTTTTSR